MAETCSEISCVWRRNYLDEDTQTFEKVAGTNPPRYKIKTLNGSIGAAVDPTTSDGDAARKKQKTDAGK